MVDSKSTCNNSRTDWLAGLPPKWDIVPLKYCFECLDKLRVPLNSTERADMQGDIPYWGAGGIVDHVDDYIFNEPLVLLGEDGAPFHDPYRKVAFQVEQPIWANNHIHVLRPINNNSTKYFEYALNTVDYSLFLSGSTRDKLTQTDMNKIPLPVPPVQEQGTIVDYLDNKVKIINELVKKKNSLLDLLEEKRRVTVRDFVCKGIDCQNDFKDSGVDWLGKIPKHWDIWKVSYFADVGNGSTPNRDNSDYWSDGSIPWLRSSVVNQNEITSASQYTTSVAVDECHLPMVPEKSILIGLTGQGKTRGKAALLNIDSTINQHIAYVTPRHNQVDPEFLRWVFYAAHSELRRLSESSGSTRGAITCSDIKKFEIPKVPINEQKKIGEILNGKSTKISMLENNVENSIKLLKEKRQVLITDAVTGQIDLSDWDSQEDQELPA